MYQIISDMDPCWVKLWTRDLRMPQSCQHGNEAENEIVLKRVLGYKNKFETDKSVTYVIFCVRQCLKCDHVTFLYNCACL